MANFPVATPSFTGFTSSHTLSQDGHAAQHNLEQGEIIALANKVGTGSSTPVSGRLLRGTGAGTTAWAQADLTTDVTGVLPQANGGTGTTLATGTGKAVYDTSPTISTPTVAGGTFSSPTLTTPLVGSFTNANHDHTNSTGGGQLNAGTALIADSLPASVMKYGMVLNRQGSTTGDASWQTAGSNSTDTSAKDVLIQVGAVNSSAGGAVTVTFPTAFSQAPLVYFLPIRNGAPAIPTLDSVPTTTGFTLAVWSTAGALIAVGTNWIAIGQ